MEKNAVKYTKKIESGYRESISDRPYANTHTSIDVFVKKLITHKDFDSKSTKKRGRI